MRDREGTSAPRSAWLAAALGGAIGLLAFEASVGLELVRFGRFDWLMGAAPGDWTPHFVGWHMFRHQPWSAPLGALPSLLYPIGTSVGLTDSIPLLAIPFKALGLPAGRDVQYIGLWLLGAFVLQGICGALLTRTRTPALTLQGLGAALFVLAPPLLARIGHPALTAHWLVLGSLWVYVAFDRPDDHRRATCWQVGLVFASAATHPYLALMVFALAGAYYLRALGQAPSRWLPRAVVPVGLLAIVAAVTFWQAGYFVVEGRSLQGSGVGNFSMNALAPFMPMGRSRFFGAGPFTTATGGQYEGYAYLGAGMLLLGVVALVTRWRLRRTDREEGRWSSTLPLVVVCAALTILALSPRVTVGAATVLEYSEAWWGPLAPFRASGRLIWPAYYALTLAIVLTVVARLSFRRAFAMLLAAVTLQAVDGSRELVEARGLRQLSWRSPLATETFWASALPHYRHLSLFPTNLCAAPLVAIDYPAFAVVAGRAGTTLNAGLTSRVDPAEVARYCRFQAAEREAGVVWPDTLHVMSIRLATGFARRAQTPVTCIDVDQFGVCFETGTYRHWQDDFDVNLAELPPLAELLDFRQRLDAEYRDVRQRPSHPMAGETADRVRALARFVAYRLTGCDRGEALDKVERELQGHRDLRLCARHLSRRLRALDRPDEVEEMPPRNEVADVLRRVDEVSRPAPTDSVARTHVDTEGEAVWMLEYIRHRLIGRSPAEAHALVLEQIRAVPGA